MLKPLLQAAGWLCAHAPEVLVRMVAEVIAFLFYHLVRSRRRLMLSNLHHAFPDKPAAWHRSIARQSVRRFVETGLLSLATPFLSEKRLRTIIQASSSMHGFYAEHRRNPRPTLICAPHLAYWEVLTAMPLLEKPFPEFGAIYRPLDNEAADAFVKASRERFGMRLLSRRDGFQEAVRILRRNGLVAILYDQNAGSQGALTLLFDRVCSTTELVGLLSSKFRGDCVGLYARRCGFWRAEIRMDRVPTDGTSEGATIALNRWLEQLLAEDDNMCASWLWGHQRWKNQDAPATRFRLEQKRSLLDAELRLRQLAVLPRKTRIWIRLPNWLGDVVMALPLLRALREGRPDAEITLIAKSPFLPLLEQLKVADRLRALPVRGGAYYQRIRQWRHDFPDCYVLLTNSPRGDLEAWCTAARQRFGILRRRKPRPLLTHAFRVPPDFDEAQHHQFELWTRFFRHFGLTATPDTRPFLSNPEGGAGTRIGLICGSENNPEKRWPVPHWRTLIAAFPRERFVLLGTATDRPLCDQVAAGNEDRVENLAGTTDLLSFAATLRTLRLLVTNDTGGMHLANALGVPVVVLFGPTNPIRTGPVFSAPAQMLQPPGCPPTGGAPLATLTPETVIAVVESQLSRSATPVSS